MNIAPNRILRCLSVTLATALLAACASAPAASGPAAPSGGQPGASAGPSEIANLPDLGLSNVGTETSNARAELLGPAGGTVTATGSDGTMFSLNLPPHALDQPTQIALYPVATLNGLPAGATLSDAVQFAPDGLRLAVPATLTITPAAQPDATKLGGYAWHGDGQAVHPYPALVTNGSATIPIDHFSGGGLGNPGNSGNGGNGGNPANLPPGCASQGDMETLIASDVLAAANAAVPSVRAAFTSDLKRCYRDFLAPTLTSFSSIADSDVTGSTPFNTAYYAGLDAYNLWLDGLADANDYFPGFTVAEAATAKGQVGPFLRHYFEQLNLDCIGADKPTDALAIADVAIENTYPQAMTWGVATTTNKLDYQRLLDDLCVQVVIDPSRTFSAAKPGDQGTVTVPVDISINGQPAGQQLEPILVQLTLTGDSAAFDRGHAPADGIDTADLQWPDGVDPIQIDILANIDWSSGLIARFDRITKSSGKPITVTAPGGAWANEGWPSVWPTCEKVFMATDEGEDWTFSLSGPATVVETDGDHIYFRGTDEGVVSVTGHSPTQGGASYTGYMSPLQGEFENLDLSEQIIVQGKLDKEGILTWEVRHVVNGRQIDDWTNLTADGSTFTGTDSTGSTLDVTIAGNQLTGTMAGQEVNLPKSCP